MHTLIELYDERPMENVLSTEMFRPEETVFICPTRIAVDRELRAKLKEYFRHRGVDAKLTFLGTSLLDAEKVADCLRRAVAQHPDCAVDISGGTDAALFAAGMVCSEQDLPAFTFSRRQSKFFEIRNAPFARDLPCSIHLDVESCFLMAGGALREGRVDNAILKDYFDVIDPFFDIYLKHRRGWTQAVSYLQRASQAQQGETGECALSAEADVRMKGEHGSVLDAPEALLQDLAAIGMIRDLDVRGGRVRFAFRDAQIRKWLRDVGSVLEIKVYKDCVETGVFDDVVTSAIVDWAGEQQQNGVSNEIDVMATHGVLPVFISCKTCDVRTEALNELAVLRDRFGGLTARAAIVTAESGGAAMRKRASELDIDVIDLHDIQDGALKERLASLAWARDAR
ncbi:MAG: DUF1887 family protein [Clostridiales bacterium]|nr:DUF1887 family protein [Clostridiales bacterium]